VPGWRGWCAEPARSAAEAFPADATSPGAEGGAQHQPGHQAEGTPPGDFSCGHRFAAAHCTPSCKLVSASVKFNTLGGLERWSAAFISNSGTTLMADERLEVPLSDLMRWLSVAALIVLGVVLYMALARDTPPVANPAVQEAQP